MLGAGPDGKRMRCCNTMGICFSNHIKKFERMMGLIPNSRSKKDTDRNVFGFQGHTYLDESGSEDAAAFCKLSSL